jgi:hypothetical protein
MTTRITLKRGEVIIHENTLARIDVILTMACAEGFLSQLDRDSIIAAIDEARQRSLDLLGVDMDRP